MCGKNRVMQNMNNNIAVFITLLITTIILIGATGIIVWNSNFVTQELIYEMACEKAADDNIFINNPIYICDINWYGTVSHVNYFCEKINKNYCDFNITLLNATVVH